MKEFTKGEILLFKGIRGSKAYGTYIEGKSDIDTVSIYMASLDGILCNNFEPQIQDKKGDNVSYELGRIMHLLCTSNPTVIEVLFTPDDCIIYKHPIMEILFNNRDSFLTKKMKNTFGQYAISQIRKAEGTDKMRNWEKNDIKRADVLNFCRVPVEQGSILVEDWLSEKGLKQEYCGLVKLPNMRDAYGVYYDIAQHVQFENLSYIEYIDLVFKVEGVNSLEPKEFEKTIMDGQFKNLKYKGIVQDKIKSNSISLSSIPKDSVPICNMQFNKDGYSVSCKLYRQYQEWLEKRNTERYVDVDNHGQQIDGKNMLHCVRLLRMSREIALGLGLIMRRPDAEYLLEIRAGKHNLKKLKEECEVILKENDKLFDESDLPDSVSRELLDNLLIKIRKEFYGLSI